MSTWRGSGPGPSSAIARWRRRTRSSPSLRFFFQAEDGIRDLTVTGVQTCALPIFKTIDECGADPIGVQGWPAGNYMYDQLKIAPGGRNLMQDDHGKKSIVIGITLATIKHLQIGDTLTIGGEDKYHVVGIFETKEDMENGQVVMLLEDAQRASGKIGLITGCTVKAKDTSEAGIAAIKAEIEGQVAVKCGEAGKIRAKSPSDFVAQNSQF